MARLLAMTALSVLAAGCCSGGPDLFQIWATPMAAASDPACDWQTITWNATNPITSGTNVLTVYDEDDADDGLVHVALELLDESGTSIPLTRDRDNEATCHNGCPSPRVLYTLPLEGTFTLVHRESTGSGKEVWTPGNEIDPWTTFAGERALVATLVISAP